MIERRRRGSRLHLLEIEERDGDPDLRERYLELKVDLQPEDQWLLEIELRNKRGTEAKARAARLDPNDAAYFKARFERYRIPADPTANVDPEVVSTAEPGDLAFGRNPASGTRRDPLHRNNAQAPLELQ